MKLTEAESSWLFKHYTGNCFIDCKRCDFYGLIERGEPGAVEAYAAYMLAEFDRTIATEP